jgi:hypothetical protein
MIVSTILAAAAATTQPAAAPATAVAAPMDHGKKMACCEKMAKGEGCACCKDNKPGTEHQH